MNPEKSALVRKIVLDRSSVPIEWPINDQDNLIDHGVIDSLSLIEIVTALNETFGVWIDDTELLPTNFETLAAIKAMLDGKGV